MELDNRKIQILKAIIETYLETGEPVGSRTISKINGLNVSSATIRNEMVDLEEMGLIVQPHTSAGRVPTDKGYRLYVDRLMEERTRDISKLTRFFSRRMDRVENVLKSMANMLSADTNYTAMVTGPRYMRNELKLIQLAYLDASHLIAVIVVEGNVARNKIIPVKERLTNEDLLKLNILLNSALQGKSLDDLTLKHIARLKEEAGPYRDVVGEVLNAISEVVYKEQNEPPEVYTSGKMNIFRYPELAEGTMAERILTVLEDKGRITDLFERDSGSGGIRVYIGGETPMPAMQNCAVVTTEYDFGKGLRGRIGIIGPKRMDYEHVVSTLKTLMEEMDRIYHADNREEM
ncbi:MAG: heat-inducible transcription repressor HrcA [Lachnospiraceae bacterium]|nr:heat-inducible transcription repressor HrcA [Lachnospiraceae bacterium]MBP5255239.1 heat-inducible transcription repressor HrcA [Lachnospiraceae bacterium]